MAVTAAGRFSRFSLVRRGRERVLAALGLALALGLLADALFPPDLTRYHQRSTVVLDRSGGMLRAFLTADEAWRLHATPGDVDPLYLTMLRGYEDRRFDAHLGVDPLALARAAGQAARHGRIVSGGSTLTMQVARLLEPRPRTLVSKLVEMIRAVQLEARYDKDEILSMYLTLAPFGGNLDGVRAASLAWFGREPDRLTPGEAALLVALPQSPTARRPDADPAAAKRARDAVLHRLAARGVIPPRMAEEAATEPMPLQRQRFPRLAPHLGERLRAAASPGARIATSIDGDLQRLLEEVAEHARRTLEPGTEVAILVVETAGRAVRAYVGGSGTGPTGHVDMVRAVRSPGSALKPLLYALAFEELPLHPETLIDDVPMRFGGYAPANFDGAHRGTVTVRQALQLSLNVPAVALLNRLGPVRAAGRLVAAGARLDVPGAAGQGAGQGAGLSLALGGAGIRMEDLALLYAALADGGMAQPLLMLATPPEPGGGMRIVGPLAAWYVGDILRGAPRPDGRSGGPEQDLAFKTGTSYGYRDAWAAGFTGGHTIVVWVGRPDGTPRPGAMGRDTAAPILFRVADLLPRMAPPPPPPGVIEAGMGLPLPAPMRRFDAGGDDPATAVGGAPLAIAFPPDGAEVDVAAETGQPRSLPLEAVGGTPPFRWLVNGLPLPESDAPSWIADGPGFAQITVVDASGTSVRATVRLR